jgi:16S rRNA (guanine966-N2)-methyltransferase
MTPLRVTAGSLRGRRIPVPPRDVRPTSERARQAYFNIVGERIHGVHFLDLFAGSGIFSFEAVSRGAASAVAVEQSRKNAEQIAKLAVDFGAPVRTVVADALTSFARLGDTRFGLVYADPPYDYDRYGDLLAALENASLTGDALVAIEHRRNHDPFVADGGRLRRVRRAEYGEVWITFFAADENNG